MSKIPVKALYSNCEMMLHEKWGYIMGTAGVMCTQSVIDTAIDRFPNNAELTEQYGPQWLGRMVTDCSGLIVYIYGNMGKIVNAITSKAPHAKIIFSTIASAGGVYDSFNTAIIAIANHFSIPYIIQRDDPFFTSAFYTDYKVSGHPTVQLYGGMAKAIERLTNECMLNNPAYFNDIYPTSE